MKKILLLSLLAAIFFIFSGCENNLTGDSHGAVSAFSVRSVTSDPVAGCATEQLHQHNGEYYSGHYNNDSHGHHGLQADDACVISACEITDLHSHNGIHYAGHNSSCGHGDNHGGNGHHGNGGYHG